MKTIKTILLLAVICVGVCQADAIIKRPTIMKYHDTDAEGTTILGASMLSEIRCFYDANGRLDSLSVVHQLLYMGMDYYNQLQHFDTIPVKLSWFQDSVVVNTMTECEHNPFKFTFLLERPDNQSLRVKKAVQEDGSSIQSFFYDSTGFMTKINSIYAYGKPNIENTLFVRAENGCIDTIKGSHSRYPVYYQFDGNLPLLYSDIPNPAGIDYTLLEFLPNTFDNMIIALAEIGGKNNPYLPKTRVDTGSSVFRGDNYFYELDEDGYPTKITVKLLTKHNVEIDISYASFSDALNPGGVSETQQDICDISVEGRQVLSGSGKLIQAYDMQGRLIASSSNGVITLPDAGIYIVRSGASVRKLIVQ